MSFIGGLKRVAKSAARQIRQARPVARFLVISRINSQTPYRVKLIEYLSRFLLEDFQLPQTRCEIGGNRGFGHVLKATGTRDKYCLQKRRVFAGIFS